MHASVSSQALLGCVAAGHLHRRGCSLRASALLDVGSRWVALPFQAEHLAHWGINMMQLEKTEKSLAEHELLHNQNAFDGRVTEAGSQLERLSGAG